MTPPWQPRASQRGGRRVTPRTRRLKRATTRREGELDEAKLREAALGEARDRLESELAETLRDANALEKEKAVLEGRGEALATKLGAAQEEAATAREQAELVGERAEARASKAREEQVARGSSRRWRQGCGRPCRSGRRACRR